MVLFSAKEVIMFMAVNLPGVELCILTAVCGVA